MLVFQAHLIARTAPNTVRAGTLDANLVAPMTLEDTDAARRASRVEEENMVRVVETEM